MKARPLASAALWLAIAAQAQAADEGGGYWSPDARKPLAAPFASPLGGAALAFRGDRLVLTRAGSDRPVATPYAPATVEALWAPDGRYAVVTGSDGGSAGTWSITVLDAAGREVGAGLTAAIARLGAGLARCDEPEALNATAAGWTRAGGLLVVRLEVPSHSSCANMGETRFVLAKPGAWADAEIVSRAKAAAALGRPPR